ncbi:MAG: 50S ribosomal protein L5, partial [Thermoplasmata archaeon]|nr:50S ribosomal protein L5 [Thermoplasmata archaeon]NIS13790.1 50S ribosomal protein L5 [Thermoplasmata archaeon]NIS21638.1 50S ribosomal protein L5 [Thermoplasmata archaeon]NIT79222.1 50S ribosomal protein L5 [Thermoplasmata archaeon]NIU50668.1 50S ribosomal protein L5 [Thermoplasmata archaeon]
VGEAGERLMKAAQVLEMLTDRKTVQTLSNTTNKDLGIRKDMPIGVKVTLRGEEAVDFFKRAMWVRQNRIANYSFDHEGNCSFGISDYTDFE